MSADPSSSPDRASLRGILAASVLLAAAPLAAAQEIAFGGVLNGSQMVPPVPSLAGGTVSAVLDLDADTLTLDLTYAGLGATEVSASIHGYAAQGANAPALFSLPLGFKKAGVWNYPPADEAMILSHMTYIQIATTTFPGGELRGQLFRDSSPVSMTASLDGQQEVPPTNSLAKGTAHCSIDTALDKLSFTLTFDGITSPQTAAHIHGPAVPGMEGPVKFNLPINAGNVLVGTWLYAPSDESDILNGLMYFNVHSNAVPTGEIRGQIVPLATNPASYCSAKTTSLGCTPAISSTGTTSLSGSGFMVSSAPVPGGNLGIFFYGKSGPAANPFQGGFLCVKPPTLRTAPTSSGGTSGVCNGGYSIDFKAYANSGVDPALVPGASVNLQTWFRDPPEPISGTGLSNALMFELRP